MIVETFLMAANLAGHPLPKAIVAADATYFAAVAKANAAREMAIAKANAASEAAFATKAKAYAKLGVPVGPQPYECFI